MKGVVTHSQTLKYRKQANATCAFEWTTEKVRQMIGRNRKKYSTEKQIQKKNIKERKSNAKKAKEIKILTSMLLRYFLIVIVNKIWKYLIPREQQNKMKYIRILDTIMVYTKQNKIQPHLLLQKKRSH